MLLKGFYEAPAGVFINSSILIKLLSLCFVYKTNRRYKFHINLDTLSRILHLFIRFRNVLWIGRFYSHHPLFAKETVQTWNRARIPPLHKFYPKDNQTGIRISSAHVMDKFDFSRSMLIRMMVRSAGTITQGFDRTVIATFPAINVLSVSFIFDSSFCDTKFFCIFN